MVDYLRLLDTRLCLRATITAVATLALMSAAGCQSSGTPTSSGDAGLTTAATATEPKGDAYLLTLNVSSNSGRIGALQFEIKGDVGGFAGGGAEVECDSMIDEALAAFSRHEPTRVVGAVIDVAGFDTPAAVARCTYVAESEPGAGAFSVKVTEASDVSAQALASAPTMVVSSIQRAE